MTAYLTIRDVRKSYGRAIALNSIDMDISRGEFLALLGPSGSGKTTLLRIMAGLLIPDRGSLVLDGIDITKAPAWDRDIGLVFQNYALFPHMNVRRNVGFGLDMRAIRGAEADRRIDEALEIVSMRQYGTRRPDELSGGQQQRIAIARAIAIKPRLLLLDEPLSNLDAVLRQSVRVELRDLHERTGLTTIMVTHDQVEALTVADRVALMEKGELLQIDSPEALYTHPASAFAATFLGSPPANLIPVAPGVARGVVSIAGAAWRPIGPAERVLSDLCAPARLALRPETLALHLQDTPGAISGLLRAVEYMGGERLAHVEITGTSSPAPVLLVRSAHSLPDVGQKVFILPSAITGLYDNDSGSHGKSAPANRGD